MVVTSGARCIDGLWARKLRVRLFPPKQKMVFIKERMRAPHAYFRPGVHIVF